MLVTMITLAVLYTLYRTMRTMSTHGAMVHDMMVYVDAYHVHTIPMWATHCGCGTCVTPMSTYTRMGTYAWMSDARMYPRAVVSMHVEDGRVLV